MMRVGNRGSEASISRSEIESVLRASDVFAGVRVVVEREQIARRESERRFVKRQRIDSACLAVGKRRGFVGETALNPKPGIGWIELERIADGFSIREVSVGIGPLTRLMVMSPKPTLCPPAAEKPLEHSNYQLFMNCCSIRSKFSI
jgi:hypothetical protein